MSRTPPRDIEAEKAVLGSILLAPERVDEVAAIISPTAFYLDAHRVMFSAMLSQQRSGTPVDQLLTVAEMQRQGHGEEPAMQAVIECMDSVPHGVHAGRYALRVAEQFARRQVIYACAEAVDSAYEPHADYEAAASGLEFKLLDILEGHAAAETKTLQELLHAVIDDIGSNTPVGIPTGFGELDAAICGLPLKGLTVLAARPRVGKTAFAGCLAERIARAGYPLCFVSLEMTGKQIAARLLSSKSLELARIRTRNLTAHECEAVIAGAAQLDLPVYVCDAPVQTVAQISAWTRSHVRKHGVRVLIVDYLQLVEPADKRAMREQQVAQVTRGLKAIAKELDIAVLAVAAVNRGMELREVKRPRLADLRESGAIESDADVIMFLDRQSLYDSEADPRHATVIVEKNREGPPVDVPLHFCGENMTFDDRQRSPEVSRYFDF